MQAFPRIRQTPSQRWMCNYSWPTLACDACALLNFLFLFSIVPRPPSCFSSTTKGSSRAVTSAPPCIVRPAPSAPRRRPSRPTTTSSPPLVPPGTRLRQAATAIGKMVIPTGRRREWITRMRRSSSARKSARACTSVLRLRYSLARRTVAASPSAVDQSPARRVCRWAHLVASLCPARGWNLATRATCF